MNKPTLTADDYASAAERLGVPVAAVRAVTEVECPGYGFYLDGVPKVLFERHVMYRQVVTKFGQRKADQLAREFPDVIQKSAGGYGTSASQPGRMDRAAALIDRECALNSASWGKFQIMGYHWASLRYHTQQAFINAMYNSEGAQLDAFVRFFTHVDPQAGRALKAQDWAAFAKAYNGPNYAINQYDTKLAAAFKKWSARA